MFLYLWNCQQNAGYIIFLKPYRSRGDIALLVFEAPAFLSGRYGNGMRRSQDVRRETSGGAIMCVILLKCRSNPFVIL